MHSFKQGIVKYILVLCLMCAGLGVTMPVMLFVCIAGTSFTNAQEIPDIDIPDLGLVEGDLKTITESAISKLGHPYVWGATGPDSFDCSGLMQWAYLQAGVPIGRTTWDQVLEGNGVEKEDLKTGDLIFFHTMEGKPPTHVGMYLGSDIFIHAGSEETGVLYGNIQEPFWQDVYYTSRRIIEDKIENEEEVNID